MSGTRYLTQEEEEEALSRSLNMVDCLSELAINMIVHSIETIDCPELKHAFLNNPEGVAVKAMQRAMELFTLKKGNDGDIFH